MTRFHNHFLFSALCCSIVSGVYCITVDQFYRFGESAGDSQLPRVDDGSSQPITLRTEFPFFDENHRNVYVNTNGVISFSRGVSTFTPVSFPIPPESEGILHLIAPYWADVDITPSQAGNVFYRETTNPKLLSRARSEIMRDPHQFPEVDFSTFFPTSIFVATWDHVGYFSERFDKTNTFQCVLVTDGRLSFVIFLYAEGLIQWTTGSASDGIDGFGGTPAQVGFNAGDGVRYASVEGSQTADIVDIDERRGNTGQKGVWIFRVDDENIRVTNCTSLDETADLVILPNRGHILGGTSVIVSGPCFAESQEYTCLFQVRRARREVRGVYLDERRVLCISPILQLIGDVGFRLRVHENGGMVTELPQAPVPFYSVSFFTAYQVNLEREDLLFTGEESIFLTWLQDAVFPIQDPDTYRVDVWLYTLTPQRRWDRRACLASNYPNSGRAAVIIPPVSATERFSAVAVQVALNTSQAEPEFFQNLTTAAGLWSVVSYATDAPPTREECNIWAEDTGRRSAEKNMINSITPPCPCTLQQAQAPNSRVTEQNMGDVVQNFFNPGAGTCFYQSTFNLGLGRQCCYDERGRLITGPAAGGHSDLISPYSQSLPPSFTLLRHLQHDITPFLHCCKSNETSCSTFYTFRPSAVSECQYSPPPPACVYGDPHISTLDGHTYTFNGKGEFILIETEDDFFNLQGRMVEITDRNGQPASATVCSAIVAKENNSDTVQFQVSRRGVDVLINGERLVFGDLQELTLNGVTVSSLGNNTYAATFASGAYVQVREDLNLGYLSVSIVSLPDSFWNRTCGLMGSFNGDTSDDLLPKSGSIPLPLDSPLQMIHEEFGLTWIVGSPENSLFSYHVSENWEDFFAPDFPAVFEPTFANTELETQAHSLCNGDQFCLFDIAATGRMDVGISTKIGGTILEEIIEISAPIVCEPPCLNGTCVGNNTCNCQAGYVGLRCEEAILRDECDTNICQNGGTCRRLAEDYLCLCSQYYIGLTCTELLPLEIQCSSTLLGQLLTVRCSANKPLAMTNCSLDGNPIVPCNFPLELQLSGVGVGDYRLDVLAIDTFNLTDETFITFSVEPLELRCERGVREEHLIISGCTTSNQVAIILCSFEQQLTECAFPVDIDLTRRPRGVYTLEITAIDVFNLSDRNTIRYTKPSLQIQFINSSPRVYGNMVLAEFVINRPTDSVECHVIGLPRRECSSGSVRYSSLSPGKYTLRVVARAANGEREIERRKFHIGNGTSQCTVHLINEGVLVYGYDISIQFLGSSNVRFYLCRMDAGIWFKCRSPTRIYGLAAGPHRFQVLPQGCGSNLRRLSVKFNVSSK